MVLSERTAMYHRKKSRFIKEHKASGLITSSLGFKSRFKGISLLGNIFYMYKINEIIKKFLFSGDKFILETHLRRHKFTYSARERFTKNKQKHKNLKKLEIQDIIYQKELDKAYFQHDMAYGDFKD